MNKSKKNNPIKATGQPRELKRQICNCKHPRKLHFFGYCRGNKRYGGCKCRGGFTMRVEKTIKRRKKNKVSAETLAEMK